MRRHLIIAIRMTVLTVILLGLLYPLVVDGHRPGRLSGRGNGSLVKVNGQVIGSSLIAQGFTEAKYFQPRPSAAGKGYDAMASSASNLGPTNARARRPAFVRLSTRQCGRTRDCGEGTFLSTWSRLPAAGWTPTSPSPTRAPRLRG